MGGTSTNLLEMNGASQVPSKALSLRCPVCRQNGIFPPVLGLADVAGSHLVFGHRVCPAPSCKSHVFVWWPTTNQSLVQLWPASRIPFDTTDLPAEVVSTLEEAITCHASQCYRAAAIMVRRALEMLCEVRGATGPTLYARLEALSTQSLMTQDLKDALHALRLLGNDAAHVEATTYNNVGAAEVAAAIEVTKLILQALYQHGAVIRQLTALRRGAAAT